jgi:hypothetical protein
MGGERSHHGWLVAGALLAILAGSAAAQSPGGVTGHVQNGDGQSLPGAAVKLLHAGKDAKQQVSDAEGNFRFEGLDFGVYTAAASMEGYSSVTCPGARILPGQTRYYEIKLMPEGGEPSSCTPRVEEAANPG